MCQIGELLSAIHTIISTSRRAIGRIRFSLKLSLMTFQYKSVGHQSIQRGYHAMLTDESSPSYSPFEGNKKEGDCHETHEDVVYCNFAFGCLCGSTAFGGVLYELLLWILRNWVFTGLQWSLDKLLCSLSIARWNICMHCLHMVDLLVHERAVCLFQPSIHLCPNLPRG